MAQNPKYDNDMVNLGYLNKRLGQTEEDITNSNNDSIARIPKNYSTPPSPPYYKDSLLCYGNKIYRCNTTKLQGIFSWDDWTIVATDDTTVSDFIKNTYELEKLEIQEQIDGKVQTYYQEIDPSKEWTTDLEKGRHVGDYWYNTINDTQWRYNQITTTSPITYGWGQVNVPKSVFDMIDTKKSIYTEKPTSYKKDDLWIIEENLSDEDLPVGTDENPIAKGDWVFSIADSEIYNKEHWVKRDEDVPLSYLKQHYYTITEIDSSLEIIERNTESKITKATEEISLNVSQTYTTKEEHNSTINDFDERIGTINQTITEHKETLSDLSVEVGEVSASVESIETKTEELTVDVNGVKENIIPTATATGSNIYIEDASDDPLIQLEIEGKSTQETRSGKNLLNYIDNLKASYGGLTNILNDDGSITTSGVINWNYVVVVNTIDITDLLEDGETYTLSQNANEYLYAQITGTPINDGSNIYYSAKNGYDTFTIDKANYTYTISVRANSTTIWGTESRTITNFYQLEKGSVATEFEQYGVSPSPDYPSEIVSVGYKNLWDINKTPADTGQATHTVNSNSITINNNGTWQNIRYEYETIVGQTYTLSANYTNKNGSYVGLVARNNSGSVIANTSYVNSVSGTLKLTFTATTEISQINLYSNASSTSNTYSVTFRDIQLEKGSIVHPYIPYGKTGVEVIHRGKNLFDKDSITENYYYNNNGEFKYATTYNTSDYILCKSNEFVVSAKFTASSPYIKYLVAEFDENKTFIQVQSSSDTSSPNYSFTLTDNTKYIRLCYRRDATLYDIQLEQESKSTEFEPYFCNSTVFELDEPLRSLPNGVKDTAYVQNGVLYVERNIASVVLDGSQTPTLASVLDTVARFYFLNVIEAVAQTQCISNFFMWYKDQRMNSTFNSIDTQAIHIRDNGIEIGLKINKSTASTVEELITWLSENNVEVIYELAEPYTEEIGEIKIPSTVQGVNHISTTDELEPVINIEYVRDTTLSNYVECQINKVMTIEERHYSELVVENDSIKASVTEINSNLSGMTEDIHTVQETLTSTEKTIDIISTNIDKTTGEVREVTTTTGYTLNADGLDIHKSDEPFHAQHKYDGTYYYDNETIVAETTVNGFMAVKIKNKGSQEYCYDESNKVYEFVKERIEVDGEYGYATFYNGVN